MQAVDGAPEPPVGAGRARGSAMGIAVGPARQAKFDALFLALCKHSDQKNAAYTSGGEHNGRRAAGHGHKSRWPRARCILFFWLQTPIQIIHAKKEVGLHQRGPVVSDSRRAWVGQSR